MKKSDKILKAKIKKRFRKLESVFSKKAFWCTVQGAVVTDDKEFFELGTFAHFKTRRLLNFSPFKGLSKLSQESFYAVKENANILSFEEAKGLAKGRRGVWDSLPFLHFTALHLACAIELFPNKNWKLITKKHAEELLTDSK